MLIKKLSTKIIFSFILITHSFLSYSQITNVFSQQSFSQQVDNLFNREDYLSSENAVKNELIKNYFNLDEDEKTDFIKLINVIHRKKGKEILSFFNYFNWLSNGNIKSSGSLKKILLYHYNFIFNSKDKASYYFLSLWKKIDSKILASKASHTIYINDDFKVGVEDFLDFSLYDNAGSLLGTLVFSFKNSDVFFDIEGKSFQISKSNFNYFPDLEIIQGEGGSVYSYVENSFLGDLNFLLNKFSVDLTSSKIVSSDVLLSSSKFKNIKGAFEYSPPKTQKLYSNYFDFISFDSDIDILFQNNIKLEGGVSINKDNFSTKSLSDTNSKLVFILSKGKKISAESRSFLFDGASVYSPQTYFKLYDNLDSLYHPMVDFKYDSEASKIQALNIEGTLKNTSFYSSYFDVEFTPDILNYNIGDDKIYFGMIVASNQRQLQVLSKDYFSNQKLNEQTDLNGTNMLKAVYSYSSKIKRKDFFITDLANYFKTKKEVIEGGIISLWRNGFVSFDRKVGLIKVLPKLRHYYLSHLKKSDYDELSFNSLSPSSNNLIYDLGLNTMLFQGVNKITLSKKNNIIVFPQNGLVELRENREVRTLGNLSVGSFGFNGVNLTFDYNKYLIDLIEIDTLQMISKNGGRDSYNYLYNIGGNLFINHPRNKSSRRSLQQFPSFISDQSTRVYFDMPEEYGAKYDSSFYFSIDQFRIDSLDKSSLPKFEFPGTFFSNNILNPIEGKLITMPDNSFGFNMSIDKKGVEAYNNKITLYDNMFMDSTGLYVKGNLRYNTTMLFSEKIRLFPDSITGFIDKAFMASENENNKKFQYPEMEFSRIPFSYYNQTNEYFHFNYDSLYSSSINAFNKKIKIIGDMEVSSGSVISEGSIILNNSIFISDNFSFNNLYVTSANADVTLKDLRHKSGLLNAENVFFKYDVFKNNIDLKSSFYDDKNFVLPHYDFTTSLTDASWAIDANTLLINGNNEKHFTFSQDDRFRDWGFVTENIEVDLSSQTAYGYGIAELQIADAYIIPNKKELVITEGFNIKPLSNSLLILDTINEYHRFVDANISIESKEEFQGKGVYEYVNFNLDTFKIPFSAFEIKELNDQKKTSFTIGEVNDNSPILMEPGFNFYGDIELSGNSEQLFFDGYIIPSELEGFQKTNAIPFKNNFIPGDELILDISNDLGVFNAAISKVEEGLFFDFFNNNENKKSLVFFNPEGLLSYDPFTKEYLIETNQKRNQEVYNGNSLLYQPKEKSVAFEGKVNIIDNDDNFKSFSSMIGEFDLDSMEIDAEAFIVLDINLKRSIIDELGFAFNDIIETYGAPIAHDNDQEVIARLSDIIGHEKALSYENSILTEYKSLIEADGLLNSLFVFSNSQFTWSKKEKSWHNTSSINLSNIGSRDVNASIDGFIEIKYSDQYEYTFNIFLQPAPELWVYMNYDGKKLITFSSNERYNSEMINSSKSKDKFVSIRMTDESAVLEYINDFRLRYFNIKEPYNLMSPSDTFLEDEVFKTISDDDDGFNF